MALAIDGSSPPAKTATGNTVTTASFTPPANARLVAICSIGQVSTGLVAGSVTDSTPNIWVQRVGYNINDGCGGVEIWDFQLGASHPAMTVTLTSSGTGTPDGVQLAVL